MEIIENKNKIITYLSAIRTNVEMSNFIGYYDIDRELENIIAKYNDKEAVSKTANVELKNTSSSAKLSVSTDTLSTVESNKNVKITATLLQNGEDKDLYQNPIVRITLPKQVKEMLLKELQ